MADEPHDQQLMYTDQDGKRYLMELKPSKPINVGGLMLLLDVLAEQGRDVMVIPRSQWTTVDLTGVDYVVVEDDTWVAWQRAIGYP